VPTGTSRALIDAFLDAWSPHRVAVDLDAVLSHEPIDPKRLEAWHRRFDVVEADLAQVTGRYDVGVNPWTAHGLLMAALWETRDLPEIRDLLPRWLALFQHLPLWSEHWSSGREMVGEPDEFIALTDCPPAHLPPEQWCTWWDATDELLADLLDGASDPLWCARLRVLGTAAQRRLDENVTDRSTEVAWLHRLATFAPRAARDLLRSADAAATR